MNLMNTIIIHYAIFVLTLDALTVGIFRLAVVLVSVIEASLSGTRSASSKEIIPPMEMPTTLIFSFHPKWSNSSIASSAIWEVLWGCRLILARDTDGTFSD